MKLVGALMLIGSLLSGCRSATELNRTALEESIRRGVAYLASSQNADGSWGTGTETRGTEVYSMVPGSHDAYRVATTALCVMALREAGEVEHRARGLEYLIEHGDARRDDGSLLYNTWAHTYALQCLAVEMRYSADPRIKKAAEGQLERLIRYQTYMGGWNYYDFDIGSQASSMGPTSFGVAAGLGALYEARASGVAFEDKLWKNCVMRLERMRMPGGAYLYGADYKYRPLLPANQIKGSIGRTQSANDALWLWGSDLITPGVVVEDLERFFEHHDFINMGRKRPFPHESWYQTSGYYYYFGHYYAARLIEKLGAPGKERFAARLASKVAPYQEPDGSWWDYAMWDYHKPYGTAFAVMTLLRLK